LFLVLVLLSVFVLWSISILFTFSISIPIDGFTFHGISLDNIPNDLPKIGITSHRNGRYVYPSPELTIKGTSSATGNTNCTILTSINNVQPFQNASATGSQGEQDFSNWNSTFFNATNLLRLGKNTITSLIVCLNVNSNSPTSSSHLINLTGLPGDDNQSSLSSVSRVVHDSLENKTAEQHKSSDQSRTNLQNNPYATPMHHDNDQSQSQSTLSPNSGQSTTGNP
jgi:hypothetical protein